MVLSHYVTKLRAGATKDFRANLLPASNLSDEMIFMKFDEKFTDSTERFLLSYDIYLYVKYFTGLVADNPT